MSATQPLLSVLIPARDEAGNLPTLLSEVEAALAHIPHEIIVVDDGSTDATWNVLQVQQMKLPPLRLLRHQTSVGQSTSLWHAARHTRGDWLATLDGDGQNDPADIPALLERARQGDVALVAGQRVKRRDSWLKRLSSRIANKVRAAILRDQTPDTGCGLKLIRREQFLTLPYFDHMHRFLPALIQSQGGHCVSLPVNHRARQSGTSHYGLNNRLWAGIVDMLGVMWLQHRSRLPLPTVINEQGFKAETRGPIETRQQRPNKQQVIH